MEKICKEMLKKLFIVRVTGVNFDEIYFTTNPEEIKRDYPEYDVDVRSVEDLLLEMEREGREDISLL